MRRIPQLTLIALVLLSGCSKSTTEPGGSSTSLPPTLVATQPAPWATGVLYDSEFWGQFDRALDPATVDTKSVFLKLDGQRIPITVAYEELTRRIFVHPTVTLELQRTYTVDFTPAVFTSDGTPLPEGVFFQFTTNSLRRPRYDYPAEGALEGPLATLGWGGTQGPVGQLWYELYAGPDSIQVEQRTAPRLQYNVFTRFVPAESWPAGQRIYWAITSENITTGERLPGEVKSFQVLDGSIPAQSVDLIMRDWGSNDIRNRNTQYCNRGTIPVGPGFNGGVHWDYSRLPVGARVVGATMTGFLPDIEAGRFNSIKPVTVWMTQNDWQACTMIAPGPPWNEMTGLLASATEASSTRLDFTSPRLGAFLEAQARGRTLITGLVIRGTENFDFQSPISLDPSQSPRVTVQYQLLPAGAAH
jgi:hypothetical protein